MIVGAIVLAIALLISKALSGIFGVALYRYATGGEPVGGFTAAELESAVQDERRPQRPADGDSRHGAEKAFTGRRRSHSFGPTQRSEVGDERCRDRCR